MKQILHIQSSPRIDQSVSRQLGREVINKILEKYPDSNVNSKDLAITTPTHLNDKYVASFFTPSDQRDDEQNELIKFSDDAIAELKNSDIIVIESPMYNFNITSTLKSYFDHIMRSGETFKYTENGTEGLILAKKVYIVFSAGFAYTSGPMVDYNHNVPFLEKALGFMGMTDITIFKAEGLALTTDPATLISKTIEEIIID